MHDVIVVGLPLFAILAGIFFNNARFDRIEGRLDRVQADLSQFYQTLGRHEAKIESLEKQR